MADTWLHITRTDARAIIPGISAETLTIAFTLAPELRNANVSPVLLSWRTDKDLVSIVASAPEHIGLFTPALTPTKTLCILVLDDPAPASDVPFLVVNDDLVKRLANVRFVPVRDSDFLAMARVVMSSATDVLVANWDYTSVCRQDPAAYADLMAMLFMVPGRLFIELPSHAARNGHADDLKQYMETYARYIPTLQRLRADPDRIAVSLAGIPRRFSLYGHKTLFLAEAINGVLLCRLMVPVAQPPDYSFVRSFLTKLGQRRFLLPSELTCVVETTQPLMPGLADAALVAEQLQQYRSCVRVSVDPKTRVVKLHFDRFHPAFPTDFPSVCARYFGFDVEYDQSYEDERVLRALV